MLNNLKDCKCCDLMGEEVVTTVQTNTVLDEAVVDDVIKPHPSRTARDASVFSGSYMLTPPLWQYCQIWL